MGQVVVPVRASQMSTIANGVQVLWDLGRYSVDLGEDQDSLALEEEDESVAIKESRAKLITAQSRCFRGRKAEVDAFPNQERT